VVKWPVANELMVLAARRLVKAGLAASHGNALANDEAAIFQAARVRETS
jgi:hypothetical protein